MFRAGEMELETRINRLVLELCVKVNSPRENIREKQRTGNTLKLAVGSKCLQ